MESFHFHLIHSLPKLAWCAVIRRGEKTVEVFHGSDVETGKDLFVEGAWDGSFEEGAFDRTYMLAGSGGKLADHGVLFCSPSHTLERLHLIDSKSQVIISNSLAFALKRSGSRLDIRYIAHTADLYSIVDGLEKYVRTLPTENGENVRLYYHCNLKIDPELNIQEFPKAIPPPFTNFQSYRDFLSTGLKRLFENANSSSRKVRYQPITTISSGYDSPTCAALAQEVGCTKAITFRKARPSIFPPRRKIEDSGTAIAGILGLAIKEVDRDDYTRKKGINVEEFVGCGDLGGDLQIASLEDECRGSIFITGFHGDKLWDLHNRKVAPYLIRGDSGGASSYEFRFRVGFLHLPLVFFGAVEHPSIHKISNAQEMNPWILGRLSYDRPIPRRILEEKGVHRELFGQQKLAVGVMLSYSLRDMQGKMDSESFNSFLRFYKEHRSKLSLSTRMYYHIMYRIFTIQDVSIRLIRKLRLPLNFEKTRLPRRFQKNPCVTSFLLHWGLRSLEERYRVVQK